MSDARTGRRRSVIRGVLRIAWFRTDGFGEFTGSRQAFLNSLAPLIAFPLVGGLMMLVSGGGVGSMVDLLGTLVALLSPAVISAFLADRWQRGDAWLRYAVAFNWCQWAVPMAAMVVIVGFGMLMRFGLSERTAALAALFAIAGYGLALHWFLARHGLALSRLRTVVFVLLVNFGTAALVIVPRLVAAAVSR